MTTPLQRAYRRRLAVVALVVVLGAFAGLTFYRWGTGATDENIFADPISGAYVTSRIGSARDRPAEPAIEVGDLILAIGTEVVRHPDDLRRAAAVAGEGAAGDAEVAVKVLRPQTRHSFTTRVPMGELRRGELRDISNAVIVTDVTPDGASARAGVQVGDVIVRINGQPFATALQADAIMREGKIGHATAYDILRQNKPLTLHVMLASFGFNVALLALVMTGVLWMAFGASVALARPLIKAALYLGLAFISIGFVLEVLAIRRDVELTMFALVRDTVFLCALFLGLALWNHSDYYFPREHPKLLGGWRIRAVYALAIAGGIATAWTRSNVVLLAGIGATFSASQVGQFQLRRDRGSEERQILRPIRLAKWAGAGLAVGLISLAYHLGGLSHIWFALLTALLLVPLAYAFVIVKYRLLDLDVRVRRSVQYSVASAAWGVLSALVLLWLLTLLPYSRLPVPNLRFTGMSIELLDAPLTLEERAPIEKGILMLVAIGLAFLFRSVGRSGQRWIADKFHRTAYDYRRASAALGEVMSSRLDLDGLADGVLDTIVHLMPLKRAGVMFVHDGRTYCGARARGFRDDAWAGFCAVSAADVVQACSRTSSEVNAEYVFPRLRRALTAAEILYLFPIRSHDKLVGIILAGEKLSEAAFEDDDFQFLGAIAHQVSAAVENAFLYEELAEQERLKHELAIARRIQLDSLPQFTPIVEGLDIAGISVPAFEVGGDYYDYLNGQPCQLTVMVGDVSGKGTSAALYMSKLQGILRSLHAFNLTPHELFVRTNQLLCRDLERRAFVTAIGGFFHTNDHRMVLARAGHLPLYYFDARSRQVRRVLPGGLGFGLSHRHVFDDELEEHEIPYAGGDVFLFITDGITECQSAGGDDFGEERVIALLDELASEEAPAATIRDRLLQAVRQFASNVEQFDDQTVVVVRVVD